MGEEQEHNHNHNHQHSRPAPAGRPSITASFANLRGSGLSWRQCLAALAANNWRKIRNRQNCCGHLGQPGC